MGRSDETDVVCILGLQLQKNFRKPLLCNQFTAVSCGNIMILAINAMKVAARKENRTGSGISADARLLPHVKGSS